jgi:phosphoribosylformylglycinamidine synthase subunit PurQ / glutaminase
MKPKALVFSGYGLNCEEETKFAFESAGAHADIVHINDLIDDPIQLGKYQILAFPGGFAYGDDTGSGNAYANKLKNHIWKELEQFIKRDTLVIGVCNGFQILTNLGLLPALGGKYGQRQTALLHNDSARYTVRWVDLRVENKSPWLSGMTVFSTPVAHGEGKFYAAEEADPQFYTSSTILNEMKKHKLIALRYVKDDTCSYHNLSHNPNGALDDIAGITDQSGRIFGLMPHPERGIFFTQLPQWPLLKELYKRQGKHLPKYATALQIFKNAVKYFK